MYDYTTSGHLDLSSKCVLYVQYIYIYIEDIYLFLMQ